jgi:hypothetical protein
LYHIYQSAPQSALPSSHRLNLHDTIKSKKYKNAVKTYIGVPRVMQKAMQDQLEQI